MEVLVERAALRIDEAARYIGIGRASLYRLMDSGAIRSFHVGERRLVLRSELDRFIALRVEAEGGN